MTKIQDTIAERLELYKSSIALTTINKNRMAIHVLNASEEFLRKNFVAFCPENNKLTWLECAHMTARRLAMAIRSEHVRHDSGLPDSELQFEHIALYNRNKMLRLIKCANETREILESGLSSQITAQGKKEIYQRTEAGDLKHLMTEPTLVQRLAALVEQLEQHTSEEVKPPKGKRGSKPFRREIIFSLTMAWFDLTGKPPEKLKRNRGVDGDPIYGDFADYMEASRRFIGGLISFDYDTAEAIKDANLYWKEHLAIQNLV